jgi:adenine phosphoribosyltransferase
VSELETRLKGAIRAVPDFPKPGILFRDITPVLEDPALCNAAVQGFQHALAGMRVDALAGIESRGFLFGMPLALALNIPFVTVRKKGKLPWKTVSYKYELEYGSAEWHRRRCRRTHSHARRNGMRLQFLDRPFIPQWHRPP